MSNYIKNRMRMSTRSLIEFELRNQEGFLLAKDQQLIYFEGTDGTWLNFLIFDTKGRMPKQARIDIPGHFYHVVARGIEAEAGFLAREEILRQFGKDINFDPSRRVSA
ncbi:MAG: hypothetical protein A2157_04565 [Deltaproteobacteria bacterium RBG_16_47_11]|nr:MAG: hypothetical protein A2157_04565 [Deltaproteobacteria bacterium RBG_16_47_11]